MKTHNIFLLAAGLSALSVSAFAQDNLVTDVDEIIVTGSPLTRSVDEAITGLSVLSGDELSDRLAGTIGETLKSEPGVSSTFFGAGASRPIVRGQGGDRVRVLTNGIGSIDASSASPDHAVAAEPAQAERIEVLRGAALLRYGSSGSGGIINVIDGRIPADKPDGIDGAVRIGASSVDNGREGAASLDVGAGNIVLHLDGTFRETDNYRIPGFAESEVLRALEETEDADLEHSEEEAFGRLDNSATKSTSLTGGLSFVGESGFIGIALHKFNSDYGIPGGHGHGVEDEGGEGNVTIGLEQTRMDINGALEIDGFFERLQFFGGVADYTHTEFEAPGIIGTVFTNQGYEARLEAIQTERKGWKAAHGIQIRKRDFAAIGDEAFVPPTTTQQFGIYTFHEKEIGDFHLEGAARFETTQQENAISGDDRDFDLFSLSAGGDIHFAETWRLGGTIFRTERAPTTEELFSNGPHLATNQFERGDPGLGKEIAAGVEAAIRHRASGHFITMNLFYTDYTDYIFDGETGLEQDGLSIFQFSAVDATFKGFELQGGIDIGVFGFFDIKADALAEYVRAKTEMGNLPRIPPLSVLAGIEAENGIFKFRGELDYADAQSKIAGFEIPTDDHAQVNLFATWRPDVGEQDVAFKLSVLNVFDSDVRQHTSFLKDTVPLPGRNVRFSMSAAF